LAARRRRLNTASAAAPNSKVIGGAGTSVPVVELLVLVPVVLLVLELVLVLDEVELLVEVDDDVLVVMLPELLVDDELLLEPEELLDELPDEPVELPWQ
jgi:hypothetical protein